MKVEPTFSSRRRAGLIAGVALAALPWVPRAASAPRLPNSSPIALPGRTLQVSPDGELRTIAAAAKVARDGDIIEVAPGDYRGDVAVWRQRDLVIRGVGQRPRLIADGISAQSKGIFVLQGDRVRIENLAFFDAQVSDRNGAGIRLEKGHLELVGCHFENNENGVLVSNESGIELNVDRCSFVGNGTEDGRSHNLYVGTIARLTVTSSYFAKVKFGHLLKSRARENEISYCRLTSEDAPSSYELEFPNGGVARVMGCLIQQGPQSENATIVSYGAEGYRWPRNELLLTFNTIVNDRPQGGIFVRVAQGAVRADIVDNLLVGSGSFDVKAESGELRNAMGRRGDFADVTKLDYHLRKNSKQAGSAGAVGQLPSNRPFPAREYVHPADSRQLPVFSALTPLSPGAFQRLSD